MQGLRKKKVSGEDSASVRKKMEEHTKEIGGGESRAKVERFTLGRRRNTSRNRINLDTNIRFDMDQREFIAQRLFCLCGR